ncbi:MAG TPA: SPOR domain-containing protein [Steroidobacteraceae bacterium]|nr:SPOR domain-containing protein [Steroidobacteraceae bacterium]
MAAPIDTALSGDIWHLGIDDLFAPLPETIRLGGPGPFVINLTTSSAPIALPAKSIAGCEYAQLYQLQRIEDRRPRYRLRVGPFASEDEADAILKIVRDVYPGALTATADAEDLRAIANLPPKAVPPPPAAKPAAATVPPPSFMKPAAAIMPPRPVANLAAAMAPPAAAPPVLTVEQRVSVRTPAAKPPLSVMPAVVAPPVLRVEQKTPMRAPQPKPVPASVQAIKAATPAVPPAGPVHKLNTPLPDLESTQTVRALTQLELNDEQASRWFVIQLSLSEDAYDPETVPNLDIFSVYRLYCVAGIDQGRIVHALRLGFFSEEIAASAVASYLAAFYDKPAIKRVSAAERQRFADQSLKARKDVGATGRQAVIEITDERFVRERRIGQAAAKSTRT